MARGGQLAMRLEREDTLMPGRRHARFTQMVNGVPVYGADVARQIDEKGLTVSIFGTVYEGIDISTEPASTPTAPAPSSPPTAASSSAPAACHG